MSVLRDVPASTQMQSLAESRRGTAVQGRQGLSDEVEACLDAEDITALVGLQDISQDAAILLLQVSDEQVNCRSSLPSVITVQLGSLAATGQQSPPQQQTDDDQEEEEEETEQPQQDLAEQLPDRVVAELQNAAAEQANIIQTICRHATYLPQLLQESQQSRQM